MASHPLRRTRGWDLAEDDIETVVAVTRIRTQGNTTFGRRRSNPASTRRYRCGQEGGSFCQCAVLGFVLPPKSAGFVTCSRKSRSGDTNPVAAHIGGAYGIAKLSNLVLYPVLNSMSLLSRIATLSIFPAERPACTIWSIALWACRNSGASSGSQ